MIAFTFFCEIFDCTSRLDADSHFLIFALAEDGAGEATEDSLSELPFHNGMRLAEPILCGGARPNPLVESTEPRLELEADLRSSEGGEDISLRKGGLCNLGLGGTGGGTFTEAGDERSRLDTFTGVERPELRLPMDPSLLATGILLLKGLGVKKFKEAEG